MGAKVDAIVLKCWKPRNWCKNLDMCGTLSVNQRSQIKIVNLLIQVELICTLFISWAMDWIRPQCFSARKRYRLSSSSKASRWLSLRKCMYSLPSWGHINTHVQNTEQGHTHPMFSGANNFFLQDKEKWSRGGKAQMHRPGWLLSSSASPTLLPGYEPQPHISPCCPVWQFTSHKKVHVHKKCKNNCSLL